MYGQVNNNDADGQCNVQRLASTPVKNSDVTSTL